MRLDRLDGAWWSEHFVYGKRVLDQLADTARVIGSR